MQRSDCDLAASPWKRGGGMGALAGRPCLLWGWLALGEDRFFSACLFSGGGGASGVRGYSGVLGRSGILGPSGILDPSGIRALSWPLRLPGIPFLLRRNLKNFHGIGVITDYLNGLAGQLLDILHICLFLNVAEGKRPSSHPGAPCTADSVDIGLRNIGQVEIDDAGQFLDINAPGGDIRGNKDTETARFKIAEGGLPGALGFVPVDGGGSYAGFIQVFGPPVRAVLGAGEYQGGGHILVFQQMHKQGPFVGLPKSM